MQESYPKAPLSSRGEPKGPPGACLFVASLAAETSEETIKNFFSQYGDILKIKLLKDRSARPYAFVQFLNIEDANNSLQNTNGKVLDGRRIRVEKAKVNRTLFIAKMSRVLTNQVQKLREIVEEFGPVESVTIIKNHQTNKSKGCGFVKFVYREDAMDALMGLKNSQRKWVVEWATSTNDPDLLGVDKYNIFIGGLNPSLITKESLEERFAAYGHLESVTLINRSENVEDDKPRSAFAFIRYAEAGSSAAAIEHENGAEWLERRIRVQYCESPEMKNKRRQNKYMNSMTQFNNQYYRGVQVPTPMLMQTLPSLKMGGLPAMYNVPMGTDVQSSIYTTPFTYPMIAYTNGQPWLYSPQAQQQQAPRVQELTAPSSDENTDNTVSMTTAQLAHMSLSPQPSSQQRNLW